jgi:hypothetical protein
MYSRKDADAMNCTVAVNASDHRALKTEWFRISFPRTSVCDRYGSCSTRRPWRCSSWRIRRIGSRRTHWSSDRRPSRGRGRWSSRYSSVLSVVLLPVVLPSLLVSLLPTIPVLSAVLSYNDSIRLSTVSDAVVPRARFRILVDGQYTGGNPCRLKKECGSLHAQLPSLSFCD